MPLTPLLARVIILKAVEDTHTVVSEPRIVFLGARLKKRVGSRRYVAVPEVLSSPGTGVVLAGVVEIATGMLDGFGLGGGATDAPEERVFGAMTTSVSVDRTTADASGVHVTTRRNDWAGHMDVGYLYLTDAKTNPRPSKDPNINFLVLCCDAYLGKEVVLDVFRM